MSKQKNNGIGKKVKKFDKLPEFLENSQEILQENLSIADIVYNFKQKVKKKINEKRWKSLKVKLEDIARVFDFEINENHFNWLPKRFRDEFNTQGIHFKKQRGRNYAVITLDD